jgi:hypothetical protein
MGTEKRIFSVPIFCLLDWVPILPVLSRNSGSNSLLLQRRRRGGLRRLIAGTDGGDETFDTGLGEFAGRMQALGF